MNFNKFRFFFDISNLYTELTFFIANISSSVSLIITNVLERISCFILRRFNLNKADKNGDTFLHKAIDGHHSYDLIRLITRLIKCGADANAVNNNGDTVLHRTAHKYAQPKIMASLLQHVTDINAINKQGYTPLHTSLIRFCRDYVNFHLVLIGPLWMLETLTLLIEKGASVNTVNTDGDTPLFTALRFDIDFRIVTFLLEHGANVNAVDRKGETPLFRALGKHKLNSEIITSLIKHGADVNAVDRKGDTPLFHELKKLEPDPKKIALLIKLGANVNAVDESGFTPLRNELGKYKPNVALVALLIELGANVNAVDKKGNTPLFRALKTLKPDPDIVTLLIEHGASLNAVNNRGDRPLDCAVLMHNEDKPQLNLTELIIASLLENINTKAPKYRRRIPSVLTSWDICKAEIQELSVVIFNSKLLGKVSLLSIYTEKDENNLALIARNENVNKLVKNQNFKKKYPNLGDRIQTQFQKGLNRNRALNAAFNSIFSFNTNRTLNEDCWKKILKKLTQADLKNVTKVAGLFFDKSPSNDSCNFLVGKAKAELAEQLTVARFYEG